MTLFLILAAIVSLQFCKDNSNVDKPEPTIFIDSLENINPYDSTFLPGIPVALIENDELSEGSGMAVSRKNPTTIWAHNDSGNQARLFLMNNNADDLGFIQLKDIQNRDWEDMAIAVDQDTGESYIYIADIGDNGLAFDEKIIYKFEEPDISVISEPLNKTIDKVETIRFKYPDGRHDAETLLIDPISGNLYIISKSPVSSTIYRLDNSTNNGVTTLTNEGDIHIAGIVGGDISSDGQDIILKTYTSIYYWRRNENNTIAATLKLPPGRLAYFREAQGEAIGIVPDGSAYYTISEEPQGIEASLIYYMRNK